MDNYDQDTVKQITKQFPRENSIRFLLRMVKETCISNKSLTDDLKLLKEINKKQRNTIENLKREISILKLDAHTKEAAQAIKLVPQLKKKLKDIKELVKVRELTIDKLIFEKNK